MRLCLPLSVGALAFTIAAIANAAPSDERPFVVRLADSERVSVVGEHAARLVLARTGATPGNVELALKRRATVGQQQIFKFAQVHRGLPVMMRGAAISFDTNGVATLATTSLESQLPASVTPALTADQAAARAATRTGLEANVSHARLVVWPTGSRAALAYVVVPPSLLPLPYAPMAVVDALTGDIIASHNLVRFAHMAKMFEFNPVKTPELVDVQLPVADGTLVPTNSLVESYNCVDTKETKTVTYSGFSLEVHVCQLQQNAVADATTEDFTQHVWENDTEGGDPFAQLSIFYHTNKAYSWFRAMSPGFELHANAKPLFLVSNLMMPAGYATMNTATMKDPNLPLEPFSNAFYTGWDPQFGQIMSVLFPEITGAALFFGQGPKADFSYDGDVVYHEFGHAVVDTTIQLSGAWHHDSQGATAAPGAMNEALADYFSSAITGDGDLGEYVAKDISTTATAMRHLDNDKTCPADLTGEVHADAEFFSAALWKVRSELGAAEQASLDLAIFATLNAAASGDIGYEDLASAFVTSVAASALGQTVSDQLQAEFETRGVLPVCDRTFTFEGKAIRSKAANMAFSFVSAGKASFLNGSKLAFAPGLFQVKIDLPAGTSAIDASFSVVGSGSSSALPFGQGTPFAPSFLVSFGAPIAFSPAHAANTDTVVEATKAGTKHAASIPVPAGSSTAYVMVVNKGDQEAYYTSLMFTLQAALDGGLEQDGASDSATEQDSGTQPLPDGGGDSGEVTTPVAATPPSGDESGCGCRLAARPSGTSAAAALLVLIGAFVARRRRGGNLPS